MTSAQRIAAFGAVSGLVVALAASFRVNGYGAEDLRQEALLGALEAIERHQPARASLATWVARVVRHKLLSVQARELGKSRRMLAQAIPLTDALAESVPDTQLDLEADVIDRTEAEQIRGVVEALDLSIRDRMILEGVMAGWSGAELGRRLSVSRQTAHLHKARLLARIRTILSAETVNA